MEKQDTYQRYSNSGPGPLQISNKPVYHRHNNQDRNTDLIPGPPTLNILIEEVKEKLIIKVKRKSR
jgi:hypothetical protein